MVYGAVFVANRPVQVVQRAILVSHRLVLVSFRPVLKVQRAVPVSHTLVLVYNRAFLVLYKINESS